MKTYPNLATALAMIATPMTPSFAGESSLGSIYSVLGVNSGVLLFKQTGTRTGRPSCSTQDRWAIDATTVAGQALASLFITAVATHRKIYVSGTGTCSAWGDTESVGYIPLED